MTKSPFKVVAIAGGSGSGKTTFARKLAAALGEGQVTILSQDSYYRDQSARFDIDGGSVNFDHPDALDFFLLGAHLQALKRGESAQIPIYDFPTHTRKAETQLLPPHPLIFVDGTLVLGQAHLLGLFDHRIFLDVPEIIRFERRLRRDVEERGRNADGVKRQFELQVAPMHNQFVQPSVANATIVISHGTDFAAKVAEVAGLLRG